MRHYVRGSIIMVTLVTPPLTKNTLAALTTGAGVNFATSWDHLSSGAHGPVSDRRAAIPPPTSRSLSLSALGSRCLGGAGVRVKPPRLWPSVPLHGLRPPARAPRHRAPRVMRFLCGGPGAPAAGRRCSELLGKRRSTPICAFEARARRRAWRTTRRVARYRVVNVWRVGAGSCALSWGRGGAPVCPVSRPAPPLAPQVSRLVPRPVPRPVSRRCGPAVLAVVPAAAPRAWLV